jgi:hypothetical protein
MIIFENNTKKLILKFNKQIIFHSHFIFESLYITINN